MFKRYAIYLFPDRIWGDCGARWLGWDCRTGTTLIKPSVAGGEQDSLTKRPRKYGFHATLKAPFRCADNASEAAIGTELQKICATVSPIRLDSVAIARLGPFFALTAPQENEAIQALASRVVRELDRFRAPLSEAELTRQRKSRLTRHQDALLTTWGYPFVLDQFRFHLTLTGPCDDTKNIRLSIEEAFRPAFQTPLVIDALCLAGEAADGYFHEVKRVPLAG